MPCYVRDSDAIDTLQTSFSRSTLHVTDLRSFRASHKSAEKIFVRILQHETRFPFVRGINTVCYRVDLVEDTHRMQASFVEGEKPINGDRASFNRVS